MPLGSFSFPFSQLTINHAEKLRCMPDCQQCWNRIQTFYFKAFQLNSLHCSYWSPLAVIGWGMDKQDSRRLPPKQDLRRTPLQSVATKQSSSNSAQSKTCIPLTQCFRPIGWSGRSIFMPLKCYKNKQGNIIMAWLVLSLCIRYIRIWPATISVRLVGHNNNSSYPNLCCEM